MVEKPIRLRQGDTRDVEGSEAGETTGLSSGAGLT